MRVRWVISDDGSMSPDEVIVLFFAAVFDAVFWARFYVALHGTSRLYRNAWHVRLLGFTPPLLVSLLFFVLLSWADPIVRGSVGYLLLFALVGAAWMALVLSALPLFGLSFRDDVLETNNPAAATAVSGALAGSMLSYCGSNVGSGRTIWTTLGPALLSLGLFFAAFWLLERFAHCSEAVTIDRDRAAGLRLGGFLIATGAILGRSAAGDYRSVWDTCDDLARGSAVVLGFLVVAVIGHRATQPTPARPSPPLFSSGVLVASAYLGASAAWVLATLPVR